MQIILSTDREWNQARDVEFNVKADDHKYSILDMRWKIFEEDAIAYDLVYEDK